MSDSERPHRWQPTRLPHPWDSPGKNTGVGCHFLLQCMKVKTESEVAQSCPTLSDPADCSLPGSSVRGIFQARVLEWVAIVFSMVGVSEPVSLLPELLGVQGGFAEIYSSYSHPSQDSIGIFPCYLKLPLTNMGWSASFFCFPTLRVCLSSFRSHLGNSHVCKPILSCLDVAFPGLRFDSHCLKWSLYRIYIQLLVALLA